MKQAVLVFWLLFGVTPAAAVSEPLIIAHRGASGYLPEHTLEATALAYGMGADLIEQDVVLTRDGVPIVLHDIHLDATTDVSSRFADRARDDGRYYAIDFTLAEIKRLKASERIDPRTGEPVFAARFPADAAAFEIPTFIEAIELIEGLNAATGRTVGLYPEVKAPAFHREAGYDIARIVVETLQRRGYGTDDRAWLQTFDFAELKRIRGELGWQGRLVQLIGENDWELGDTDFAHLRSETGLAEVARYANGIGPWLPQVIDEAGRATDLVDKAHAAGLLVHPYTLRADRLPFWATTIETALDRLRAAGIDGIFTDHPDLVAAGRGEEAMP